MHNKRNALESSPDHLLPTPRSVEKLSSMVSSIVRGAKKTGDRWLKGCFPPLVSNPVSLGGGQVCISIFLAGRLVTKLAVTFMAVLGSSNPVGDTSRVIL